MDISHFVDDIIGMGLTCVSEITPWIPINSVSCKDGVALTGPLYIED